MTLQTILSRLYSLDHELQALISETGFDYEEGLGNQVALDPENPEDLFLKDIIENMMIPLGDLHDELVYLKQPTCGEHRLEHLPDDRYGYISENGTCHTLTCGSPVEALVPVKDGPMRWIRTRIEHDGTDYFLWLHGSVPLEGLTVRERGWTA